MKINNIAFINPKSEFHDNNPVIHEMFVRNKIRLKPWLTAPLNLITLASYTPQDIEIKLIDEFFQKIDFDKHYDIVAITAMTKQINRAYFIANEFKKRGAYVVLGGIHVSFLPDEALRHADTVIIGEGETLWPEFLKDYINNKPKKIYKNELIFDLKKSLIPRYELINYQYFQKEDSYFKFIPVQVTRGCPHNCSFCLTTKFYGKKIRKKSIDQVIAEIEYIKKLKYDNLILFVDDNLFVDQKFAKELLKNLLHLKIKYVAQSDIRVAEDDELLQLAYESGCIMIFIGFESVNTSNLNGINRNNWKMKQVTKYEQSIKKIQDHGIVVFGAFVIGFDNDTQNSINDIENFVLRNKIPAQFTILTPLPGTDVYEKLKSENRLNDDFKWEDCSFFSLLFKHENLTKKEMENAIVHMHDTVFNEYNTNIRNRHMIDIYKKLLSRYNYK